MAFESGAISLRMCYVPKGLPENMIDRFADAAAPPIDALGRDPMTGWVTGRHLLDRVINEDTAMVSGYVRMTLMKAERKIPEALLRAECKMEELAELQVRNAATLPRSARSEIKKAVIERLLPQMPPTLTGIDMVASPDDDMLYTTATGDKPLDAFTLMVRQTMEVAPIPITPGTAAIKRHGIHIDDLPSTSFSPELEDELAGAEVGRDFLTWVWFCAEARGGILTLGELGEVGVMVEGPLTLVLEGDGAHEALLRKGMPIVSSEAKTALLSGKKLKRARLTLARGDMTWAVNVDADEFVMRGLKLPKGEAVDPIGRFQERMLALDSFRDIFLGLYDRFLAERTTPETWQATQSEIHEWVTARKARW